MEIRKIEVLDDQTIDKIAAGEVVERPSSIVKELVENAIDAGATAVTVEIDGGGKKLVRITDNGCGIPADQVRVAFYRHATSKIRSLDDLQEIGTLGFRGEALSSIAAVAKVELITKTTDAISGIRYTIEGGNEGEIEELGAPDGTTFLVRDLFYNVPVRQKFLKSEATEGGYVSALMEQLALSHPEVSFKFIQNRAVKLHSAGNGNIKDVIYSIYGRDIARALVDVNVANDFMEISGFVGRPEIARGNRSFENYYINGRYVKNKVITRAIEEGYKGFLMQHKFPFVSLQISMTGNDLDVNVHPSKLEVRFAREMEVYDAILSAIRGALSGRELIPQVAPGKPEPLPKAPPLPRSRIPEPFEVKRRSGDEEPASGRGDILYDGMPGLKESEGERTSAPHTLTMSRAGAEPAGEELPMGGEPDAAGREELFVGKEAYSVGKKEAFLGKEAYSAGKKEPFMGKEPYPAGEEELFMGKKLDIAEKEELFTGREMDAVGREELSAVKAPDAAGREELSAVKAPDAAGREELSASKVSDVAGREELSAGKAADAAGREELSAGKVPGNAGNEEFSMSSERQSAGGGEAHSGAEKASSAEKDVSSGQMTLFQEELLTKEARSRHRLVGQIFDTYWLVEFGDAFYIIDQHAAHEKIYYERFVKKFKAQEITSQLLTPPLVVTLTLEEMRILDDNTEWFRKAGFDIEPFGGREVRISAVPSDLYMMTEEELFHEMLDSLQARGRTDRLEIFAHRLATMACKAAVKGGMRLSTVEANALIDELLSLENPYHCPHGRPTIIAMTRDELDKKFHRIL